MFAKSLLLAALVASVTAAPLSADPATTTADQTPAEVASGQNPSTDDLVKLLSDNGLTTLLANMNGGSPSPAAAAVGPAAPETSGTAATTVDPGLLGGTIQLSGSHEGGHHSGASGLDPLGDLLHGVTALLDSLLGH